MQDCPIGSTLHQVYFRIQMLLFTSFYIGRPGPLWPTRSTLADQVHFGRSGQLWPTSSASADQVHFDRPVPLWPIRSTVADQVHFGRSSPLWPIKPTWLRSTWPSDFVISSGHARLSHRIDFTSGLLQDPDASFLQVSPWPIKSTLADQVHLAQVDLAGRFRDQFW